MPILMRNRIGKMIADKMPTFKLSPKWLETIPTRVGPLEQPKSPANAISANIAVPPPRMEAEALLKDPGHKIPTDSPHNAQPINPKIGDGTRAIQR